MKFVHLVIPGLFLPKEFAAEMCNGLAVPALEKMLGRGASTAPARSTPVGTPPLRGDPAAGSARAGDVDVSLENLLCEMFGIPCRPDAPIAPISAAFDGLGQGCWLRADPVHLGLQRDQLLLAGVLVRGEEADAMCADLNAHFAGQGMEFFAPHPQRWYVRLEALPRIFTTPLSEAIGADVRKILPAGDDAARWHQVFNEIQMLLHAHPLNEARDARGESMINSVWLWGAGNSKNVSLQRTYDNVRSDDVTTEMFAKISGAAFSAWPAQWHAEENHGRQLLVWTGLRSALQRGDLAAWRNALQEFESGYAVPLWQALRSGSIANLQIDILGSDGMRRVRLTRRDTWAFWRRAKRLPEYSM